MRHHSHEDIEIDMRYDSHGDWHSWSETVGFVFRRITRRRFNMYRGADAGFRSTGYQITVEFDILSGTGDYITTGLWSFPAKTLLPLNDPVCTPVSFENVFSPRGICGHFQPSLAKEILLYRIQRLVLEDGSDDSLPGGR
jgi:hypothetical protein